RAVRWRFMPFCRPFSGVAGLAPGAVATGGRAPGFWPGLGLGLALKENFIVVADWRLSACRVSFWCGICYRRSVSLELIVRCRNPSCRLLRHKWSAEIRGLESGNRL